MKSFSDYVLQEGYSKEMKAILSPAQQKALGDAFQKTWRGSIQNTTFDKVDLKKYGVEVNRAGQFTLTKFPNSVRGRMIAITKNSQTDEIKWFLIDVFKRTEVRIQDYSAPLVETDKVVGVFFAVSPSGRPSYDVMPATPKPGHDTPMEPQDDPLVQAKLDRENKIAEKFVEELRKNAVEYFGDIPVVCYVNWNSKNNTYAVTVSISGRYFKLYTDYHTKYDENEYRTIPLHKILKVQTFPPRTLESRLNVSVDADDFLLKLTSMPELKEFCGTVEKLKDLILDIGDTPLTKLPKRIVWR